MDFERIFGLGGFSFCFGKKSGIVYCFLLKQEFDVQAKNSKLQIQDYHTKFNLETAFSSLNEAFE